MFQLHTQIQTMVRWGNGLKVLLFYDRIHCLLGTCRCVTACTSYMGHSIVWQDLLLIWDMLLYDCMTAYSSYVGHTVVWQDTLLIWDAPLYDCIHFFFMGHCIVWQDSQLLLTWDSLIFLFFLSFQLQHKVIVPQEILLPMLIFCTKQHEWINRP